MAPVALVGRSSAGADAVKSSLAPDYDLVGAFMSTDEAASGISGVSPKPVAVMLSDHYTKDDVSKIQGAGGSGIAYLLVDSSQNSGLSGQDLVTALIGRVKAKLGELGSAGKLGADGVYEY